jgi:predicted esterase
MNHSTMQTESHALVGGEAAVPAKRTTATSFVWLLLVLGASFSPAACSRQGQPVTLGNGQVAGHGQALSDLSTQLEPQVSAAIARDPSCSAETHLHLADRLKISAQYEAATIHYLAALRLDPKLVKARYQMACGLALWGKRELAFDCLRKAVDDGYWGYEAMRDDEDLASISGDPAFGKLLARVKERYAVEAPKHARDAIIAMPNGDAPAKGWPVVLFLHGYGVSNDDYETATKLVADYGYVGIAPCGIVLAPGFYGWPEGAAAETHNYLRPLLEKYRTQKDIDFSQLYLFGFSQGATIAAGLVAAYPETYAGAVVYSPGGKSSAVSGAVNARGPARPLYVACGRNESPFVKQRQKLLGDLWRKAKWPLREESHPGGHELPADWDEQFPLIIRWMLEQNKQLP